MVLVLTSIINPDDDHTGALFIVSLISSSTSPTSPTQVLSFITYAKKNIKKKIKVNGDRSFLSLVKCKDFEFFSWSHSFLYRSFI